MKAVIPVAGIGSRLRPHTHTQPKSLIPVAGKPILAHIIDSLIEAGFKDFVFIIGYLGEKIQTYVEDNYKHINSIFIMQTVREGIGHAIWMAREHLEGEDQLLIALGDTIFDVNMNGLMQIPYSTIGTKRVEDPRRFGVVELGADNFITKLVEKPAIPVSNIAIVGIYKINEVAALMESLQYIVDHNIRTKNEFQLTDAMMRMIDNGYKFVNYNVENWFDCGKKDALLETNAILLKKAELVTKDLNFENTIIIQPVNIDKSCRIHNSIIGPNVSIGARTIVENCVLRESIIGSDAELRNAVLHDSLIGNEASLRGLSQSLNLGDSTEINFE